MEQDKHIVKSYDDEMKEINNNILDIGSLVEDQLKRALIALKNQDSQLAERVTEDDNLIDEKFRELDQNLVLIWLKCIFITTKIKGNLINGATF